MAQKNRYALAVFGVNGAGKSTVTDRIMERYHLISLPKTSLGAVSNLNAALLSHALHNYRMQAEDILDQTSTQRILTSRLGPIDILVYAQAFRALHLMSASEWDDLSLSCLASLHDWPRPDAIVHLNASEPVLIQRLKARLPDASYRRQLLQLVSPLIREICQSYASIFDEGGRPMNERLRQAVDYFCVSRRGISLDTTVESVAQTTQRIADFARL